MKISKLLKSGNEFEFFDVPYLFSFCVLFSAYLTTSIYFYFLSITDGCKTLHTLLVKHYNDLLERQIPVTLHQWKVWNFLPEISSKIFLENRHTLSQGIYQKRPWHRSMQLSCPTQSSVYQASHCSASLIWCVKFCTRLYIEWSRRGLSETQWLNVCESHSESPFAKIYDKFVCHKFSSR